MHKNDDVEIFRLHWSHSEVFLKQNAATFTSQNVNQSSFFVVELIVLELRTTFFDKCTEIGTKTTKTSNFLTIQVNFMQSSFIS